MKGSIPNSPFTTHLLSSPTETELRLRSIFQWKKKRPPAVFMILAALTALLCGGLVSCQPGQDEPPADSGLISSDPSADVSDEKAVLTGDNRKEDFYTFLIAGLNSDGGSTDAILLAAYDVPNQKLNVMSIPRDTLIDVSNRTMRINAVYNVAGGGDGGVQALCTEIGKLMGFTPDYNIVVQWKAVGELVDAVGGVWFDVPCDMNYDDPAQDLHIHINKGNQLLDGEAAMGVICWKNNSDDKGAGVGGYPTGDLGRIETQQAFLKAVVAQCLQVRDIAEIQKIVRVLSDNVQTNLTLANLMWFAGRAGFGNLSIENVSFLTMPGDYESDTLCILPDGERLLAVVNESLNPYLADRTAAELDIASVAGR